MDSCWGLLVWRIRSGDAGVLDCSAWSQPVNHSRTEKEIETRENIDWGKNSGPFLPV
jgi:hypothetical protein